MKHIPKIPKNVSRVTSTLSDAGYSAYLVGGCVRDLLLGREPKDWDVTTNAKPEEIQKLFEKTVYENDFGTVAVVFEEKEHLASRVIEVTPFRLESKYSDKRHPDEVQFAQNIADDLKRRDFTVNAIAIKMDGEVTRETVDLFSGEDDIKNKIIRAVGDPKERFNEDALRILRAIRLATELSFTIDDVTRETIKLDAHLLKYISKERIKDEVIKIFMAQSPSVGLRLMRELGVLEHVIPDLCVMFGVEQNKSHIYDVWEHSIRALDHAARENFPLEVRIAALLHDVGKPKARRFDPAQKDYTFYGHDVVGARITQKVLKDLKFPVKQADEITKLVRLHMFFSDTETITLSAVRRVITKVGKENIWNLMKVRIADRIGMGRPKAEPYRLRKYESMIEEALRDPIAVTQLAVNGRDVMDTIKIEPGPKIGHILNALLEEVLDDPAKNSKQYLTDRVKKLAELPDAELQSLGEKGKEKKGEEEEKEIKKLRDKYHVE